MDSPICRSLTPGKLRASRLSTDAFNQIMFDGARILTTKLLAARFAFASRAASSVDKFSTTLTCGAEGESAFLAFANNFLHEMKAD
jgi:hypothetical protein